MDRKDITDPLQDPQLNEFWGAGIHNLFCWLEDNANTDFYESSTVCLREYARQSEGNCDMDVMAACVHDAGVLRTMLAARVLLNGERINVSAERDFFRGVWADVHHEPSVGKQMGGEPVIAQNAIDGGGGAVFLVGEFGVGVEIPTPLVKFGCVVC